MDTSSTRALNHNTYTCIHTLIICFPICICLNTIKTFLFFFVTELKHFFSPEGDEYWRTNQLTLFNLLIVGPLSCHFLTPFNFLFSISKWAFCYKEKKNPNENLLFNLEIYNKIGGYWNISLLLIFYNLLF